MLSNLDVYLAIAEEAIEESERLDSSSRTPRPDGDPGFIIASDPTRASLKKSLIAIAFSAMFFEALLFIVGTKRFGRDESLKIDRLPYEDRLRRFGLSDPELLQKCQEFRKARKDLVHEKALEVSDIEGATFRFAQKVARDAVRFVKQISDLLRVLPNPSFDPDISYPKSLIAESQSRLKEKKGM
jgi:hypothetical protein